MGDWLPTLLTLALAAVSFLFAVQARRDADRAVEHYRAVRTGQPVGAPRNVRLILDDGRELPAELRYQGCLDGVDHWMATAPITRDQMAGATIVADHMPHRVALGWELVQPGDVEVES